MSVARNAALQTILIEAEDRLDRIAKAIYGSEGGGTVEALLAANPGLAALGVLVPEGTLLTIPAVRPVQAYLARPWD